MKPRALVFAVLVLVGVLAMVLMTSMGGTPPTFVWTNAAPILALFDLVLVLALVVVAVIALIGVVNRKGAPALRPMLWIAPIFGLIGMAQEAFNVFSSAQRLHVTRFEIISPYLAASLLPLCVGLLIAAIAAWANPRKAAPAA